MRRSGKFGLQIVPGHVQDFVFWSWKGLKAKQLQARSLDENLTGVGRNDASMPR